MLSYQHGYHAGNFADVHKHTALCLILKHFANNKKVVTFLDSHSGSGIYSLLGDQASKTQEWKDGIERIQNGTVTSHGLELYMNAIKAFQEKRSERTYPGSPALTQHLMTDNQRGVFFELHPAEFENLQGSLGDDQRLRLINKDAMQFLVDFLPGRKSDGALLIDPSYELKEEYDTIAKLTTFTHKRWPAGILMVWYPMLPEGRHEGLKSKLKGADFYELIGPEKERGMYGTGLAIYNAPEDFHETFKQAENEMRKLLF